MASLQKQAVSSVKWTTLQTVISAITGPIFLTIKARFLSPEEFAYIAIILIVIGLFRLLESFGISQAIIQKDSISTQESSSLFFLNIFISLFLAGTLYIISPFIANFYSLPQLDYFLKLVTFVVLFTGPSLLFRAFLQKYLYFKHLSIIELIKNILQVSSATIFLVFDYGVLGVIYGHILATLFATISIVFVSLRFKITNLKFYFAPSSLKPFIRFGIFVSGKQVMTFITHRVDELVIGYFLAPEILGIYHFGKNMLERLRTLITSSFGKVLFPVLSKMKHNREKLSQAYQRISHYIAIGAFPIFGGIAVTAHLFVPLVFGQQWNESVVVFQVFSVAIIFLVLTANVSSSLLYSVNKPNVVFYIDVVTNVIYFITLLLFASYGMIAVLISYSAHVIYKTMTLQYFANSQLTHRFLEYFRELASPALSTVIMIVVVLFFQTISKSVLDYIPQLVGSIFIGTVTFGILSWFLDKKRVRELSSVLVRGKIG